jgi:energy-coupling factor transporter ATP-binding protein EcfA2
VGPVRRGDPLLGRGAAGAKVGRGEPAPKLYVAPPIKRFKFKSESEKSAEEIKKISPPTQPPAAKVDGTTGEAKPDFATQLDQELGNAKAKPEPEVKGGLPMVLPRAPKLPVAWDDVIEAMNKRHAIIDNVGGKTVIAGWEPSQLNPERMVVVFQQKESFLLRYSNRTTAIDVPDGRGGSRQSVEALGQWWLRHRQRRQHRGITFLPGGAEIVNDCLNLWQDWGVEAKLGDWSLIRKHIEVVLAGGNEEFALYIVRWIAWAIQNPAAQAEVALVLVGPKGAGKGTLVRCLQRIFGAHAFQVTSREEVIGKFNGHLQDCVLFVADEAYWGGDKRCVGRLQGMITEPTLPIERKGFDLIQVPNFLHVVMLAEPGWVIPAGRFERRYAAVAVSNVRRGDKEYFRDLHRQIADGGAEAMFYDLARMDLGDWHPREIPEALLRNPELQKQQTHTLAPLEQWYVMLLHNGVLSQTVKDKPNTAWTRSLVEDAKQKVPRLRGELTEVGLRNFLLDEERIGTVCTKYRSANKNGWSFPPLSEARSAWERCYGPVKWDNPDDSEWGEKEKEDPKSLLEVAG